VPWSERLRWFSALHDWLQPEQRQGVRALLVDSEKRILLVQFQNPATNATWWATPGGGIDPGESPEDALRRELAEELGLHKFELGPLVWEHESTFPWDRRLIHQQNRVHLVRVERHDPQPSVDLQDEGVAGFRWWSLDELARTNERLTPADFLERVRTILGA
jgi:8-oxo-dGTP pyrophosphatase MutT (NUDIX family)